MAQGRNPLCRLQKFSFRGFKQHFSAFEVSKYRRSECGHFVFHASTSSLYFVYVWYLFTKTTSPSPFHFFPLKWRVRKEAMMGLAQLYKKYCLHAEAGKDAAEKVSWIKDKLLHIYYQNSIDDKWVNLSLSNVNCIVIRDTLKIRAYPKTAVISHSVVVVLSMIYLIISKTCTKKFRMLA